MKRLTCCVCGDQARGKQWWNRDAGYGVCAPCARKWAEKHGAEDLERSCGVEGVNWTEEPAAA